MHGRCVCDEKPGSREAEQRGEHGRGETCHDFPLCAPLFAPGFLYQLNPGLFRPFSVNRWPTAYAGLLCLLGTNVPGTAPNCRYWEESTVATDSAINPCASPPSFSTS